MKTRLLKKLSIILAIVIVLVSSVFATMSVYASEKDTAVASAEETEETEDSSTGAKALAAAIVVGLGAAAGAIGMGLAVAKSSEAISRQPEAAGKINSTMMLGLVFIETAIIYALIVAILIIFVL